MSDEAADSVKAPTLFRNYISFAGAVIVAASLASIFSALPNRDSRRPRTILTLGSSPM